MGQHVYEINWDNLGTSATSVQDQLKMPTADAFKQQVLDTLRFFPERTQLIMDRFPEWFEGVPSAQESVEQPAAPTFAAGAGVAPSAKDGGVPPQAPQLAPAVPFGGAGPQTAVAPSAMPSPAMGEAGAGVAVGTPPQEAPSQVAGRMGVPAAGEPSPSIETLTYGNLSVNSPSTKEAEKSAGVVTALQKELIDLGYDIGRSGIDGDYGWTTEAAIKAFQDDFGLPSTGVYDSLTASVMRKAPTILGQRQDPRGEANEFTRGYKGGESKATVNEFMPVFGWEGRNGPSQRQQDAFELLRRKAIEAGITGTELQQLLAQAAVESQWYTKTVEGGGGSASNISGGKRYLGRGPIQLTHDFNYRLFGQSRGEGDKYVNNPELLNDPELATEASLWYWTTNVQPNVTDFSDTFAVSGIINRGSAKKKALHLEERKKAFASISVDGSGGPRFIAGTDLQAPATETASETGTASETEMVSDQRTYKIRPGDKLSNVASSNDLSLSELLSFNPQITNPNSIRIGQEINLGPPVEEGTGEGGGPGGASYPTINVPKAYNPSTLGMIGGVRDADRVWQGFNSRGMAHDAGYKDYSQLFREYTTKKKPGYIQVGVTAAGKPVYAAPDYLKDEKGNYVSVNKDDAVRLANSMGGIIPTRKMVEHLYGQATRIRMHTIPNGDTGSYEDSVAYTKAISDAMTKGKFPKNTLFVHGKEFAVPNQ